MNFNPSLSNKNNFLYVKSIQEKKGKIKSFKFRDRELKAQSLSMKIGGLMFYIFSFYKVSFFCLKFSNKLEIKVNIKI